MKKLPPIASVIASGALVILSSSCGSGDASSGGAPSARSGGPLADGKRLYLTRCTSCHAAEPVGKYSSAEWRKIIPDMSKEAKLNAAQAQAVLNYVLSGG